MGGGADKDTLDFRTEEQRRTGKIHNRRFNFRELRAVGKKKKKKKLFYRRVKVLRKGIDAIFIVSGCVHAGDQTILEKGGVGPGGGGAAQQ